MSLPEDAGDASRQVSGVDSALGQKVAYTGAMSINASAANLRHCCASECLVASEWRFSRTDRGRQWCGKVMGYLIERGWLRASAVDWRKTAHSAGAGPTEAVKMVPRRGLEPPRVSPLVPETSASTNSATSATAAQVIQRISFCQ